MVEAPGTAPGSEWLITTAFIAIVGSLRRSEYMSSAQEKKVPMPQLPVTFLPSRTVACADGLFQGAAVA